MATDAAADHRALTEAALAAHGGSPVPANAFVTQDALAVWINTELAPKIAAIGQRLDALEATLARFDSLESRQAVLEQTNVTDVQAEWAETFNRSQAQHGEAFEGLHARLDDYDGKLEGVGERLVELSGRVDNLAAAAPPPAPEGGA